MVSQAPSSHPGPRARREPLFDVHPQTGAVFEVFYSDRTLETFGKCGAGGFGGLAGVAFRQTVRRLVHLLRATQHIATR